MKVYLISNNSLLDHIDYDNKVNLDLIRMIRPLSIEGEVNAKKISDLSLLNSCSKIYSSFYSSAVSSARYLANKLQIPINLNENLNECKVGTLGSKNIKMIKGLQDHEFTYKLVDGESLVEVGNRIDNFITKILEDNIVIYTHRRAILGYLLKYAKVGYNLDENLILTFSEKVIYDDTESLYNIYEVTYENKLVKEIKLIS